MLFIRIFILIIAVSFINVKYSYAQNISSEILQDSVTLNLTVKENIDTNNYNIFQKKYYSKKIALVLSGGGARGISQLGVIKKLSEQDIRFDMIVGTSMGSIIGGFYSSGYTVIEIKNILNNFDWDRALSLTNKYQRTSLFLEQKKIQDRSLLTIPLDGIKPIILPSSFSNGQYLSEQINSYILNSRYHAKNDFNNLKFPFSAVASDFNSGKRVILNTGNLSESIKASFTFPLLYSPIRIDGKDLVDGGLTENVPTRVAKSLGADYIIAVNSTSPLKRNQELDDPLNTADQIMSITMTQLNNLQLKDANVVIKPDLKNYSATNFSKIDYLVSKGENVSEEIINKILSDIDSLDISDSKYFNNFIINPEVVINSDYLKEKITDTLHILTDKKFEKYTSIERNLRMIYKTGYFSDVNAVISRDENSAKINYNLISNPELRNVKINTNYKFLDSLVNSFKVFNLYKPVNFYTYRNFYDEILGVLRNHSLSLVEITKFYFKHLDNTLEIELSDGFIKGLELEGNKKTNDNVITREIKVDYETPVLSTSLSESISNVMSTNLFKQVSFDFDFKKKYVNPFLKVNVIEKNSKALRFSLKFDNNYNLQLLLDLRDENVYGTGVEAGFLAAGGLRNRIYQIEVKSNQFFSLPLTFNLNTYYGFRDIYRYQQITDSIDNEYKVVNVGEYRNVRGGGISFLFGTQIERLGTIYAQTNFENQAITNIENSESLSEDLRVIKLKFGGIFDSEDVLPFPTKGALANVFYETANDILEGNLSYTKFYFSYEQYFPIANSMAIRPRFIFGFADNTTPLTEQYSLGGEKSFFGMVLDELRGRQIMEISLEYRYLFPYKLFFDTYVGIRYDLGNVWQFTQDIRFKDLRHGIGLTSAFDTPIGEASFSVGQSFLIKKGIQKDSFIFGPIDLYFSFGYDI
jgi:NTE family protein